LINKVIEFLQGLIDEWPNLVVFVLLTLFVCLFSLTFIFAVKHFNQGACLTRWRDSGFSVRLQGWACQVQDVNGNWVPVENVRFSDEQIRRDKRGQRE